MARLAEMCRSFAGVTLGLIAMLGGCAPVRGFPDDPADRSELNSVSVNRNGAISIVPLYGPASEDDYDLAGNDTERGRIRDRIVRNRMYGYNVTYSDFKRRLTKDGNLVSAGGSLAALIVGGLGATTGSGATASALAAAGAGIVGAQGVVNRDLYFQKTLPALIAQMDAARDRTIASILRGLKQSASVYSLADANVDLQHLNDAGSIDGAINTINEDAGAAKTQALQEIERTPAFILTRDARVEIESRITSLSSAQVVTLANSMVPALAAASPEAQTLARRYLPPSGNFTSNQTARARQFVRFWADMETMTPPRIATWNAAIQSAAHQ